MGRTSRRSERDSREPIRGPGGAGTSEARVRRRGSGRVPSGSRRGRRCLTGSSRPVAWTRARFTVEEARWAETLKSVSSEIRRLSETRPVGIAKRTTPPSHNGAPRTKPSPGMGAPTMFATSMRISAPALLPAHRQRIVSRVRVDKEGTSGCRQRHVALSSSSDAAAPLRQLEERGPGR